MKKRSIQSLLFSTGLLLMVNCLPLMANTRLTIITQTTFNANATVDLPSTNGLDPALVTPTDSDFPQMLSAVGGSVEIGEGGPGSGSHSIIIELSGAPSDPVLFDLPYQNVHCQSYPWPGNDFHYYGFKFVSGDAVGIYGFHNWQVGDLNIHKFSIGTSPVKLRCVTIVDGVEVLGVPFCSSLEQYIVVLDGANNLFCRIYFTDNQNPLNPRKDVCVEYDKQNPAPITVYLQNPPPLFAGPADSHSSTQAQPLTTYPNPFTDLLEVALPGTSKDQDIQISLYDLQGRQILDQQFPGGSDAYALSTQDVEPGLYVLHARSGDISQVVKVLKAQ